MRMMERIVSLGSKWSTNKVPHLQRLQCLTPLLLLFLVFALTDQIRIIAGLSNIALPPALPPQLIDWRTSLTVGAHDAAARIGWSAALGVFLVIWAAAIMACLVTMRRACQWHELRWAMTLLVMVIAVFGFIIHDQALGQQQRLMGARLAVLGFLILIFAYPSRSRSAALFGMTVFVTGLLFWVACGWPLVEWLGTGSALSMPDRQLAMVAPPFDDLVRQIATECQPLRNGACSPKLFGLDRVVGGLAIIALGFFALAATALLDEDPLSNAESQVETTLAQQQGEFQRLLYLAAALLVLSVLFTKSYQQWPLVAVADPLFGKALQEIADQWLMMTGTYWTLILAAVFIPVGLTLNGRSLRLALCHGELASPQARLDWLKTGGFKSSLVDQFLTVISFLGPWLVGGPLAALAGAIKPAS